MFRFYSCLKLTEVLTWTMVLYLTSCCGLFHIKQVEKAELMCAVYLLKKKLPISIQ